MTTLFVPAAQMFTVEDRHAAFRRNSRLNFFDIIKAGGFAPTIIVDMDSVLCNWEALFIRDLAALVPDLPASYREEGGTFDLFTNVSPELKQAILQVMDRPGFYKELEPIPGGVEALNEMDAAGFDVAIGTAPWWTNPTCASEKLDWMERVHGEGWANRTVISRDKTRILGDVLIDDKPVITGKNKAPSWEHIWFTQPYNAELTGQRRISNWSEWRTLFDGSNVLPELELVSSH